MRASEVAIKEKKGGGGKSQPWMLVEKGKEEMTVWPG